MLTHIVIFLFHIGQLQPGMVLFVVSGSFFARIESFSSYENLRDKCFSIAACRILSGIKRASVKTNRTAE